MREFYVERLPADASAAAFQAPLGRASRRPPFAESLHGCSIAAGIDRSNLVDEFVAKPQPIVGFAPPTERKWSTATGSLELKFELRRIDQSFGLHHFAASVAPSGIAIHRHGPRVVDPNEIHSAQPPELLPVIAPIATKFVR